MFSKIPMDEYCDDGKCPLVRKGENRHSFHLDKKEKIAKERCNREKELAKIQVKATFDASWSSVVMALGISLLVLGIGLNFNSINENGSLTIIFKIFSEIYAQIGFGLFLIGLIFFIVKERCINHRIDRLYQNDS